MDFLKNYFIFGSAGSLLLVRLFCSCGKWGLLSSCGARVSHLVASLLAEHRLKSTWASVAVTCGLSSCGSRALEHRLNSCGTRA